MLKREVEDELWLISQPDHAAVSGYLAAHWGNEVFARPGFSLASGGSEFVHAETILAIAEHDNGWWEWEADPEIDPADGLPLHLTGLSQQQAMERWRLGVPRFQGKHPYVALLISFHAYWLYAYRCESGLDPSFHHPLFGSAGAWPKMTPDELRNARQFVAEQRQVQRELIQRLSQDPKWAATVEPDHLHPHVRLLQLADALSLYLCFGAQDELELPGIPRRSWQDRVGLALSPGERHGVVCEPYPFDTDPLPVLMRARVLEEGFQRGNDFQSWWQAIPRRNLPFEFCSRR